jgi:hypothetical protein
MKTTYAVLLSSFVLVAIAATTPPLCPLHPPLTPGCIPSCLRGCPQGFHQTSRDDDLISCAYV